MVTTIPPPAGMRYTSSGLLVPAGYGDAADKLSADNQKFFKLKRDLNLGSLTGAITARYLKSIETTRDGVVYYEDPEASPEQIKRVSGEMMEEFALHFHRRMPLEGMTADLYEQLKRVRDPASGESYVQTVTKSKFGVDAPGLERVFKKNGLNRDVVAGIGGNIANQFFERTLSETIRSAYREEGDKYRTGIVDMQQALSVGLDKTPEELAPLGVDQLLGEYVGIMKEGFQKLERRTVSP